MLTVAYKCRKLFKEWSKVCGWCWNAENCGNLSRLLKLPTQSPNSRNIWNGIDSLDCRCSLPCTGPSNRDCWLHWQRTRTWWERGPWILWSRSRTKPDSSAVYPAVDWHWSSTGCGSRQSGCPDRYLLHISASCRKKPIPHVLGSWPLGRGQTRHACGPHWPRRRL